MASKEVKDNKFCIFIVKIAKVVILLSLISTVVHAQGKEHKGKLKEKDALDHS